MIRHHLIQLLALPTCLAILTLALRHRLFVRLVLLLEATLLVLLAIIPGASRATAGLLGCESPLAPLIYLLVLFCISVALVALVAFRRQHDSLTEVIRTLALQRAENTDAGDKP